MLGIWAFVTTAATSAPCTPVVGADRLWPDTIRYVVAGEIHGTAEMPATFANLVCLATKTGRPVYVALEYPASEQSLINAYLASEGGPAARGALFKGYLWQSKMPDGRSSKAFLALFDRLRLMKQAGQIRGVTAFVPDVGNEALAKARAEGTLNAVINAGMADDIKAIGVEGNALVLILVGNVHAQIAEANGWGKPFLPAAALLSRDRTVALTMRGNGGEAWTCESSGSGMTCGAHPAGPSRSSPAGLVFGREQADEADAKYDATLDIGVPTTASPPANPRP